MAEFDIRYRALTICNKNHFSAEKTRLSLIWAAKYNPCPKCGVDVGIACLNLNDVKQGKPEIRKVRYPHEGRVDYYKLLRALKAKGYK